MIHFPFKIYSCVCRETAANFNRQSGHNGVKWPQENYYEKKCYPVFNSLIGIFHGFWRPFLPITAAAPAAAQSRGSAASTAAPAGTGAGISRSGQRRAEIDGGFFNRLFQP
jgi:hypothetical protein